MDLWEKDGKLKAVKNVLKEISIISIDIFDTLLFRAVDHASSLFEKVWAEAQKLNVDNYEMSPYEFRLLREEAFNRAKSKKMITENTVEVNLKEIYEEMPSIIGDLDKIMHLEVELEKKLTYVNPSIHSLMKYAKSKGIKVALLSDMYLHQANIEEILKHNGVSQDDYDVLLVSNEEEVNKQDGELFAKLINLYPKIESAKMLHIGDNVNADYESALKMGLKSIHYDVVPTNMNSIYFKEKIRYGNALDELLSLRKLAENFNKYSSKSDKVAFAIGASILGPFLSIFTSWMIETARRLQVNRIYPLMREGELLSILLKNELKKENINIKVKALYVSRNSTYFPSLKEVNKDNLEKVIIAKNLTVRNVLELFNLETELQEFIDFQDVFMSEAYKIKHKSGKNLYEALLTYLLQDEIKEKINNYIKLKRKNFIKYLKQEMDDVRREIATVDIGYNGTIQTAIEDALKHEDIECQIHHFLTMGGEKLKDKLVDEVCFRGFIGNFCGNMDLIRTILLSTDVLEQMILSSEGSTVDYECTNSGVKPIQLKGLKKNDKFKKACWDGIFQFQKLWFYFKERKPNIAKDVMNNRRDLMKILHRLIDFPTKSEANVIGELQYDDNFGSRNIDFICSNNQRSILEKKGIEYVDQKKAYGYRHTNIVWPQGLITLYDEN